MHVRIGRVLQKGEVATHPAVLTPAGTKTILGNKGYDSDTFIRAIQEKGILAVIPPRRNRLIPRDCDCDWFVYKERHLIECFFGKINHYRRVFSRFDKLARNYMGFVRFVSLIWLRCNVNRT